MNALEPHRRRIVSLWRWLTLALPMLAVGGAGYGLAAETNRLAAPLTGVELFNRHEFEQATAVFQSELRRNSKDTNALLYLGRIAFEQNRLDDAARYFERVTTAAPQSSIAFHWLGRVYGIQARDLGPPMGIGPARRTKRALEKAVALDPDNLDARLDLATYLREAPGIVGGSRKAALGQIEEIDRRDRYIGALARGDLALADKKLVDAQGHFERAIQLEPKKTDAYYRLGVVHQRNRRFDDAFRCFEKMLELDATEKRAYYQIGKTADVSGQRLDQGEQAFRAYLECRPFFIMPNHASTHRRLGNIYLKKGLPAAAREQYLAALKLAPNDKETAAALKELDDAQSRKQIGGGRP
ncbi:MAG: tetratricopeptide repeat protein [Verrucomicrobiota bacterium]